MTLDPSKVPVVIFAGGLGARFDHESQVLPKPMIEVAGKPILQHIVDSFVSQGFREFIVLTGYLAYHIDAHFAAQGQLYAPWCYAIPRHSWSCQYGVKTVYTGPYSHTGMRLWEARRFIGDRRFVLTYGDGLSDVTMSTVFERHEASLDSDIVGHHPSVQPPVVTLTAVNPPGRFGVLRFNGAHSNNVRRFEEKGADQWISGGFMVCEPSLLSELDEGRAQLESEVLPTLADRWLLCAHRHRGYWRCMDTRRDREQIETDVAALDGRLPWIHGTTGDD